MKRMFNITRSCEHIIDKGLYCYKKSKDSNNMLLTWNESMCWQILAINFEEELP